MLFNTTTTVGKNLEILEMGLNNSLVRRGVIADNIANADTPGFKRMEVTFESELSRAIASEEEPDMATFMTDDRHISFNDFKDYRTVDSNVIVEYNTSYRNDENGVDIDAEAVDAAKNSLQYNAMLEAYSRNITIIETAIGS